MKHLKTSLIVLAGVLAAIGVVTLFVPSLSQAQKSAIQNREFSVVGTAGDYNTVFFPLLGPDPQGTSYAITGLTVANGSGVDSGGIVVLEEGIPVNECLALGGGFLTRGPIVRVPAGETVHINFPQPFVLSANAGRPASCLKVNAYHLDVSFTVVGYRF